MTTVSSDGSLAEAAELARQIRNFVMVVTPEGETIAGVVPVELLDLIEDLIDGVEASEILAKVERGEEDTVSLADVRRELGL